MTSLFQEMFSISKDAIFIVLQKLGVMIRSVGITWILAKLGTQTLAAGTLVLSQFSVCTYLMMGFLASVSILAANAKGARNSNDIAKYVRHGLVFAILFSSLFILILLTISHLLPLLGQPKEVIPIARNYINLLAFALLPFSIFVVLQEFLLSISKFKLVMFYSLLGIAIILCLSYILAFDRFGLPVLGVRGLGFAALIAFSFTTLCLIFHISFGKALKSFCVFNNIFQFDKHCFYELWQVGWPLGAKWSIEAGIFMLIAILIGHSSTNELAAQQVMFQLILISGIFSLGIDQTTMIRSSEAAGKQNFKLIRHIGNAGLISGLTIAIIFALILMIFPQTIISFFVTTHPLELLLLSLIPFAVLFQLFDNLRTIATGLLASMKDTKAALYMEVVSFWILGLSIGFILSRHHTAIVSYWIGLITGVLVCSTSLVLRFYLKVHKSRLSVENTPQTA